MSEMTTKCELSVETIEMIEQKRRQAIEKRSQRQAIATKSLSNACVSNTSTSSSHSMPQQMTTIRPKEKILNESPNKAVVKQTSNSITPYSRPNTTKGSKIQVNASMRLLSNKRFELDFNYNKEVIEVCRGFDSRIWDPKTRKWSFDLNDYKNLMTKLSAISGIDFKFLDTIADRTMNALIDARNRPKVDIDLSQRLSSEMIEKLFAFQTEGVLFGIRTGGRCLIADDMGLGKTLQAIAIAQWFREDWPLMIVCPSSLRFQWEEALKESLKDLKDNDILVVKKVNEVLPRIAITIISYDLMARMRSQLSLQNKQIYDFVILDESHYIKSDSAVRTETIHALAKSAKRVVLLTGTPALSRPMELFPQIKLIDPKLFKSKHEFGLRYCDAQMRSVWMRGGYSKKPKQIWDYRGAKNLDELKILLESTLLVRRLKTEVLTHLTKKRREMIIITVDHINEKAKKKLKEYSVLGKDLKTILDPNPQNTSHFEWYMESAFAKVQPVCQYLDQLLNKDMKMICFCHHKQMMDGIQHSLAEKRINHIRIDGSTPLGDRQEACREFQTRSDCRVALLSITACATGLNLTACSVVVFAELFWNPGILSQAEDRVHRIGQQKNVNIYYLVAKNTIDDMIWPMISKKLEVLNKAGLSKDDFAKASTSMDALESEQHLITEFFSSIDDKERQSLSEDVFID